MARHTGLIALVAGATVLLGAAPALAASPASPAIPAIPGTPATNGEEHHTAKRVLADAARAMASTRTAEVAGTVDDSGQAADIDIAFVRGVGSGGSVTQHGTGAEFQFVRVGGWTYARGNAALVPDHPEVAGTWVRFSNAGTLGRSLADYDRISPAKLATALTQAGLTKVQRAHVGTTPAVALSDTSGDMIAISDVGRPVVLALTDAEGSVLTYSHYGASITLTAPASFVVSRD